jgi:hypothetical protein
MSRREKLLAKIRNNPRGVRFEDLDSLLTQYEFERRLSGKNHCVYTQHCYVITVSFHRAHVHPKAVKKALDAIDELDELSEVE